jgi:hypothetical protein
MAHFSAAKRRPRNSKVGIRQALGVPNFSRKTASLLDKMAALPRKWVSGGAPDPTLNQRARCRAELKRIRNTLLANPGSTTRSLDDSQG